MAIRKIICPECSCRIPAADINIKALIAKCGSCDHVFDLPDTRRPSSIETVDSPPARPSGIVHDSGPGEEMFIKRSWFHPALFFMLFFCIAWDGFLVFWYSVAIFGGQKDGFTWIAVLFPICHVAVGVGLTYTVIAGFLNTTHIFADNYSLMIRHRPIPWLGNRDLSVKDIIGIELDYVGTDNDSERYSISAHHQDGSQIVLVKSMNGRQSEYVAYHLAKHLKVALRENG